MSYVDFIQRKEFASYFWTGHYLQLIGVIQIFPVKITNAGNSHLSIRKVNSTPNQRGRRGYPSEEEIKENLARDAQIVGLAQPIAPSSICDFMMQREINKELGIK